MRQCHANTRPAGIATQREDLRADFAGTADMLVGYLKLIAGMREILASLGLTTLQDLIGRWICCSGAPASCRRSRSTQAADAGQRGAGPAPAADHSLTSGNAERRAMPSSELIATISPEHPLSITGPIANTDRTFGAGIAGAIAARFDRGLADGSVQLSMTGSAGQSFGAFSLPGMRLALIGDANDGLGKGMHGGDIVVAPAARGRGRANQVLVGNAALYGATGGRVFVAGAAGERFAVRNSGATAVVEGSITREYMTGGIDHRARCTVGQNFAAGMTGGVIYVAGKVPRVAGRSHPPAAADTTRRRRPNRSCCARCSRRTSASPAAASPARCSGSIGTWPASAASRRPPASWPPRSSRTKPSPKRSRRQTAGAGPPNGPVTCAPAPSLLYAAAPGPA